MWLHYEGISLSMQVLYINQLVCSKDFEELPKCWSLIVIYPKQCFTMCQTEVWSHSVKNSPNCNCSERKELARHPEGRYWRPCLVCHACKEWRLIQKMNKEKPPNETTKTSPRPKFPYVLPGKMQILLKFQDLKNCSKYIKNSDTRSCQISFFHHVSARRMTPD